MSTGWWRLPDPETHCKTGGKMKIKMLTDMKGGRSAGAGLQYRDTRRGDIVEASDYFAEKYISGGYATGDLSLEGDDLPFPFGTPGWGGNPRAGRSPYFRPMSG